MKPWLLNRLLSGLLATVLLTACVATGDLEQTRVTSSAVQPISTEGLEIVGGQTVYVPAYSSIFYADDKRTWDLAVTLAIHSTDAENSIIIKSAQYRDAEGSLISEYAPEPLAVAPLGTATFLLERTDNRGGVGAKFVIRWAADKEVHEPMIETVMVSAAGTQALAFTSPGQVISGDDHDYHARQSIYIPAYSEIFFKDRERTLDLAVTLAIHNTDENHPITITSIRYYDTDGNLVTEYAGESIVLAPWATTGVVIEREESRGGIGANFIVDWEADTAVSPPRVESIMVSTAGSHGISFTNSGQVISQD